MATATATAVSCPIMKIMEIDESDTETDGKKPDPIAIP